MSDDAIRARVTELVDMLLSQPYEVDLSDIWAVGQFEKSAAILDARLEKQKTWNCNQGRRQ